MKRPSKMLGKALLASIFSAGLGLCAGTAASAPMGDGIGHVGATTSLRYAQLYLSKDKPPYVRGSTYMQQGDKKPLEKGEFARFEEKPAVATEEQRPTYRYVPGGKPPYKRNP